MVRTIKHFGKLTERLISANGCRRIDSERVRSEEDRAFFSKRSNKKMSEEMTVNERTTIPLALIHLLLQKKVKEI